MVRKFKHWLLMLLVDDIIKNLAGRRSDVSCLSNIRTRAQIDWLSRIAWGLREEEK
jgi:hypothetical protein